MDNAKQATPHNKLIDEIMDCRVPKTEREHAAAREIEMLREALRLPLQSYEPVGRFAKFTDGIWREVTDGSAGIPLYTTPQPQREWVGLTDDEIDTEAFKDDHAAYFALGAIWANKRLREKNT